jgi:hypothetical protein
VSSLVVVFVLSLEALDGGPEAQDAAQPDVRFEVQNAVI